MLEETPGPHSRNPPTPTSKLGLSLAGLQTGSGQTRFSQKDNISLHVVKCGFKCARFKRGGGNFWLRYRSPQIDRFFWLLACGFKRGEGYCWLRYCCLKSLDLPRIAGQGTACLFSVRGEARVTRIDKFEFGKTRIEQIELDEAFQPFHPPFRHAEILHVYVYAMIMASIIISMITYAS